MLSGFKQFILRGNVIDMAVGVVIGAAFACSGFSFHQRPAHSADCGHCRQARFFRHQVHGRTAACFAIGDFINAAISFLLVAAAVYFFVVTPVNLLVARMRKAPAPADPTTKKCPECLSEIPIDARRCAHCAQPVGVGIAA